jgi:hypothetical protein
MVASCYRAPFETQVRLVYIFYINCSVYKVAPQKKNLYRIMVGLQCIFKSSISVLIFIEKNC